MKTAQRLGLPLAAFFVLAFAPTSRAQIISWNFDNGTGTGTNNQGTGGAASLTMNNASGVATNEFSANGGGVSGRAGDYAFDLTGATGMGATTPSSTGPSGFVVSSSPALASLSGLKSMTLTGWIDPSSTLNSSARIFSSTTITLMAGSANQLNLSLAGASGSASLLSSTSYTGVNSWMFFAVTYDGTLTSNNVSFYVGTPTSGGLTLAGTGTLNAGALNTFSGQLIVGNNTTSGGTSRPFDGMLDNLAIYGSSADASGVLSQSQIQSIYSAAVPEPSTWGLLALGFGSLLWRVRRLRLTALT